MIHVYSCIWRCFNVVMQDSATLPHGNTLFLFCRRRQNAAGSHCVHQHNSRPQSVPALDVRATIKHFYCWTCGYYFVIYLSLSLLYEARRERYQPFFIVSYPMDVNFAFYTHSVAHSCLLSLQLACRCTLAYAVCSAAEQQQARSILCLDTRGTRGLHTTARFVGRAVRC